MSAEQKEKAINNLHLIFIKYICLSGFLGLVIGVTIVRVLSEKEEIKHNWIWTIVITLAIGIVSSFLEKNTKTKITNQINNIEQRFFTQHQNALKNLKQSSENSINELNETWKKRLKELENSSDNNIIKKEQMLIYLADLYMANEDRPNREKIIILASQIYGNECKPSEVKSNLTKQFANEQERRRLRAVIITIKKDSWNKLATFAGYDTFNLNPSIFEHKNELKNGSKKLFCLDIYTYLYAWLVSSIDNKTAMQYMPVEQIGLNYPTVQSPDIEKYESAFSCLIDIFTNCELSEIIDDHDLSSEQIEVCQGISPYLEELIKKLKEFDISQRVSAADQIAHRAEDNP